MYQYIDMHCDTLFKALKRGKSFIVNGDGMQSIKKMKEANQLCQFFAIFFPPSDEMQSLTDIEYFNKLRNHLKAVVADKSNELELVHTYNEIISNKASGKLSAMLTIEDGRIIEGKMDRMHQLKQNDVCVIGLTWNYANCFGFPNSSDKDIMKKGLTDFGIEAIQEMNRIGMLIDVSHLSDGGFYDVARYSKKPFIASHSNCRALVNHPRNLTDDMIRVLAENGGVAGVNFVPYFTDITMNIHGDKEKSKTSVEMLVKHVLHFIKIGGEDCIGIGTDFDGMEGLLEIDNPAKMYLLFNTLEKNGVTPRQLDKIASGNVLRVIHDAIG